MVVLVVVVHILHEDACTLYPRPGGVMVRALDLCSSEWSSHESNRFPAVPLSEKTAGGVVSPTPNHYCNNYNGLFRVSGVWWPV